jgi:pyruvate formate lyase activating enzyme
MSHFYKPYKEGTMMCTLCQHYCKIKEGKRGICGVNENVGDKIACLVYGYPSALHVDPIEKKPLYHFLPFSKAFSLGTVGCNFHCSFCQNWQISQTHHIDKSRYFSPSDIVALALEHRCQSIAYTYNEPTIFYPYARDIAIEARKVGLKNIFVSNGYESPEVIDDMVGIIDGANIDLKSFDSKYYQKRLGGNLDKILENLRHFVKNGIWIEVTTLIVPTQNDSDEELQKIATFIANELGLHVPWHISAFHPDYKENNLPTTSLERLQRAYEIGKDAGLYYVYRGNIGVKIETYCPTCGSVVDRVHGRCKVCERKIEGVYDEA